MPVSAMKFITVESDGHVDYHLLVFAFGGSEKFFDEKGYAPELGYVAAIVLGPNPALLVDTLYGRGTYATERAGIHCYQLVTAWEYILKRFGSLPSTGALVLEQSAGEAYGWKVESVRHGEKEVRCV